jgi:lysophospholipase L1-like esterase
MTGRKFKAIGVLILFGILAFKPDPKKKITVWLVGDSTMADKDKSTYPETGWGMPFHYYFDSTVTVDNRAKNGRSTRTFIEEGRWDSIFHQLKEGDYVLIQFGHNDEVPYNMAYTPPKQFKDNLLKYVNDARSKKAIPVLITPVTRRLFDASGNAEPTHPCYSNFVKEVAAQNDVPLIDLDSTSLALVQKLGPQQSEFLWIHLEKGENPHYPNGRVDNTHFNELGARKMAELVLKGIEDLHLGLAERIEFRGK